MNEKVVTERLSSIGCRIGDVFRKYHKYAGEQTVRNEYCRAVAAFVDGVPCPEPLGVGYSRKRGMYYSEYRYHELERIDPVLLTSEDFRQVRQIVTLISKIRCDACDMDWVDYLSACETVTPFVPVKVQDDFTCKLRALKARGCEVFLHGDLSLENVARDKRDGRIVVFDFQEACMGIRGWDWAYFLSCIPVSVLPKSEMLPYTLDLIKVITAIKLGRGLRKGFDIASRTSMFRYWWSQVAERTL